MGHVTPLSGQKLIFLIMLFFVLTNNGHFRNLYVVCFILAIGQIFSLEGGGINASYLNSEFHANDWIAFSLHFISFISHFYIGHH